ncbi:MAG: hypothetical protein D6695_07805 [Planctomycetota bacterium]|nr:MAG: hypothetical protein D6695_07805 [Planctomycetota bacterium]
MSGWTVKLISLTVALVALVGSSSLSFVLAGSVGRNQLAYTDRAEEGDPPQVALGIAMGAFRGLFVNILWIRANELKEEGKYYEAIELARAITQLQPRFPRVWAFHAWNMSYNISVVTQTPSERWQWVQAGIRLLRDEGIPANPNEMLLYKELAWIYIHKIGGYTDDASQYYKRKVAEEWQIVLGAPPSINQAKSRSREDVIDLYADWIGKVADAADTTRGLIERVPEAESLLDALQSRVGVKPGLELLERYTQQIELAKSPKGQMIMSQFGAKSRALQELMADPQYEQAWDALIAHTRKRVIIDEYKMSPAAMERLVRRWGPVDWRVPAAHALYWSALGVERGENRVSEENKALFDFVNTNRIIMQSLQELYRGGRLYFNFIDFVMTGEGYYMMMPNLYFAQSYGDLYEQVVRLGGIFEDRTRRAMTPYAAGYENFLKDVVCNFYRRGDIESAERWYDRLRNFEGMNLNDPDKEIEYSRPLDEFVQHNLWDRFGSPSVAMQEVSAALDQAYSALLVGELDRYRASIDYAKQVHKYYMETQYRPMVASGTVARMEYMPKDFRLYAGLVFAEMFKLVPPDEAELLYFYAPDDLKKFAYDMIVALYKDSITELAKANKSRPFDEIFPEPEGMEQFRIELEAMRAAERQFVEQLNIEQK